MMRLLCLIWLALPLWGQTWTLGTAADPCVGGTPLTIPATGLTARWGNFTCTFDVSDSVDHPCVLRLSAHEICYTAADGCAAGVQTRTGVRLENIWVNDQPVLVNFDPVGAGATDQIAASRTVFAFPDASGKFSVRVQSSGTRAAVLSSVSFMAPPYVPYTHAVQDVDLGEAGIKAKYFMAVGSGSSSRLYLLAGPAPPDTVDSGITYDGVLFLDPNGVLRLLRKDGTVTPALIATERFCATFPNCSGLELLTVGGRTLLAVPATPEALAIPQCPAGPPCWK